MANAASTYPMSVLVGVRRHWSRHDTARTLGIALVEKLRARGFEVILRARRPMARRRFAPIR